MKTTFAILFLLTFNSIFAQIDWNAELYDGVPSSDKKVIFFDDFSNDDAFWKKSDFEKAKTVIKDGHCTFSASKTEQIIWQELVMDKDGYELEVKLTSAKGKTKEPLTVLLAGSKEERLTFEIKPEGSYSATVTRSTGTTTLIQERPSVHIKQDANKIMIRVIDNLIYFFINENLVATRPLPPLKGYRYGVVVAPRNPVIIDYFIMSDLVKSRRNADFTGKDAYIEEKEEKSRHKMN